MYKFILTILSVLFMSGCAQKIVYQVDGQPVSNYIVRAQLVESEMVVKYLLLENFYQQEDDEKYKTQNYVDIMGESVYNVPEGSYLELKIYVFNPRKINYKINSHMVVGGGQNVTKQLYEGDLSRKEVKIVLPLKEHKFIRYYFEIVSKNGELMYRSFEAKYVI